MGGHPEGEVASQLALQTLSALFQREAKPKLADPLRFLHDAIIAGHHQLLRYATEKGLMDTPRTTVVACVLQGKAAYWAHCGDSRLYLVRGDKLVARTRDHSYSELQETMSHVVPIGERVNRNVLFTCLGSPGKPVVDTAGPLLVQPGDRVMLCSDGLWGTVDDDVITEVLATSPMSDAVPELVEQALRSGRRQERQRHRAGRRVGGRRRHRQQERHFHTLAGRRGLCLHHPGQPGRRRRRRRTGRRRDRAFHPRDQRSHPAHPAVVHLPEDAFVRPRARGGPMSNFCAHDEPRRPHGDALRPVSIQRGFTRHAEGSVLVSFGHTQVLCTASVEEKVPPHKRGSGEGWVTAEYGMLPRATHTRSDREAARGKQSGRTQEIQRLIGRSLRCVFDLAALGERTIHLDCDVLQADGGTRTAAITGAFVAAHDAVSLAARAGQAQQRSPIKRRGGRGLGGHRAGHAAARPGVHRRLHLRHRHERGDDRRAGGFVEVQGTAEGAPFTRAEMDRLLALADKGIRELVALQRAALGAPAAK